MKQKEKKITTHRPFLTSERARLKYVKRQYVRLVDLAYALQNSISILNHLSIYNEFLNLVDDMLVVHLDFTMHHVRLLNDSLGLNLNLSKWDK